MGVLLFRHQFCGLSRIEIVELAHDRVLLKKQAALGEALGMGIDFRNIFQAGTRIGQQAVFNLQDFFSHNENAVAPGQVVHVGNAAGGGVFNGQHAVAYFALCHGLNHVFKQHEVFCLNLLALEILEQGHMTVGTRNPLVAYGNCFCCHNISPFGIDSTGPAESRR